jgi:hypothetical protein
MSGHKEVPKNILEDVVANGQEKERSLKKKREVCSLRYT